MDKAVRKSRKSVIHHKRRRSLRNQFSIATDGVITGAADNDPAGIATFAQVGAITGFSLIWLLVLITPMVIAIEEMSARIGVVTRQGLNLVIRNHFGTKWAITTALIVFVCNIATIGANIMAMAEVIGVFSGITWQWLVVPIVVILAWLLLRNSYATISRYLLVVTFALLLYLVVVPLVNIDPTIALAQLWPIQISGTTIFLLAAVGLIGTIIAPYLMFWQTTEEVEGKRTIKDIKHQRSSVVLGFIYANVIALAIIVIAASVLGGGQFIDSAAQAAMMLKPLAGEWAFLLFSVGIVASGLIGIPVLAASTAYTGAEAFNLPEGLNRKWKQARGFYGMIVGALVIGGLLVLTGIPPMIMLLYTQVLNGILAPILIIIVMLLANNKGIMGQYTNGRWSNFFGIFSLVVIVGLDILLLISVL